MVNTLIVTPAAKPKRTIIAFEISASNDEIDATAGADSFRHFLTEKCLKVTFTAEVEGLPYGVFQSTPIYLSKTAREKIQALLEQLIDEEIEK